MRSRLPSHAPFQATVLTASLFLPGSAALAVVDADPGAHQGYPVHADVYTTEQRQIVPDAIPANAEAIDPYEVPKYAANGYGNWHYEAGHDYGRRLDLMPEGYTGAGVVNEAELLNFFTITDIHISDEETPCQGVFGGYLGGNSSAYSPVAMLTTQVLDAAVRTINAIHRKKPFDFGLSIGDVTNGGQYNELRWYIDVLDGKVITPDSGIKDDPVTGPYNDFQDAFQAEGLDPDLPWYQTLGNHDHGWLGTLPISEYLRPVYTGTDVLLMGDPLTQGPDARTDYMGVLDGSSPYGAIYGVGPVGDFPDRAPQVPAKDTNRRPLSRSEWMNEFFTTSSEPLGHGYSPDNVAFDFACYSFYPKSDLPLKVIVLDNTKEDSDPNILAQTALSQARYDWLVSELDAGQAADELMIVSAHVPIFPDAYVSPESFVNSTQLLAKLSAYPNLILWVSGHLHKNIVTPRPSTDPAHAGAEYGHWEVQTASLRDFPQQFRTFDILRNSDNTISIRIRDVDPAVVEGSLATQSRDYSVAINQLYGIVPSPYSQGPYNAELVKELTAHMQEVIAARGTPIHGAKWNRDWGWVDDTYYPWVWNYTTGNWFCLYSGELDAGVDDGYWIAWYTPDFSGYGWGYAYPGHGWWHIDSDMSASWLDF